MKKMHRVKLVKPTQIKRINYPAGSVHDLSPAVANRLRAHKAAETFDGHMRRDLQEMKDTGMSLKDAKAETGLDASTWKEFLAHGA